MLHQFLSKTGKFASKQDITDAVHAGKVLVDGVAQQDTHYQFNPNVRNVIYRGKTLTQVEKVYIVLNKPEKYVCSRLNRPEQDLQKHSVFELMKKLNLSTRVEQSLFTVGRLDEDTTGLLLLTNDGDFCNKIINADARIPKVYKVTLRDAITDAQHRALKTGVTIDLEQDGVHESYMTRPAKIQIDIENRRIVFITIDEGKKRQIRRMFESIGNEVVALTRISIGELTLESHSLKLGECKRVDARISEEIFQNQ